MKMPPLVGPKPLPVLQRPRCLCCTQALRPGIYSIWKSVETIHGVRSLRVARYWTGEYGYHNAFCGPNCATIWAIKQPPAIRRFVDMVRFEEPKEIPDDVIDQAKMEHT